MGPEVGVGMNNRAVRNIENLSHGDEQKSKGSELGVFPEVVVGVSAHQDGSTFEAGESLESRGSVAFRVTPFSLPVEMIVGNHSFPKGGNFIVRQANVSTGYGSTGKSTDKQVFGVSSEFLADAGEVYFTVLDSGFAVAPPGHCVLFFSFLNIRHGDPNESISPRLDRSPGWLP